MQLQLQSSLKKSERNPNELVKIQIQSTVTRFDKSSEGDSLNEDNMNTDENEESQNEMSTKMHKE